MSMNTIDKSGPAFPCDVFDGKTHTTSDGITRRDYFAAKAMQAIVHDAEVFWDKAAPLAYQYADAMLKARTT